MDESIDQRLRGIEQRLQRIEERLDLAPIEEELTPIEELQVEAPIPIAKTIAPQVAEIPMAMPVKPRVMPPPLPITPSPGTPGEGRGEGFAPRAESVSESTSPSPHPIPLPEYRARGQEGTPARATSYAAPKAPHAQKQGTLEQAIGLKWAGWIGAVVLLIGAALGVKYAFDQHWFAALPVWIWPSIIAACGFALLGAGEWVYRKVNVIPAASLFGAGIATLFLVSYIGHSYYELYSPTTAFILMGLTTLIGSSVAMRGKLVSIAVLSLIGGNVAPLVMGDTGAPHSTFMAYLLMLEVVALTLAWWGRSRRWWMLRGLSLATTALWTSAIIAGHQDRLMPLGFAIVYAILYHAEVIASAMLADRDPEKSRNLRHGGTVFVTLVIAGLTAAILTVLDDAAPSTRAIWLLAEAVACELAAFALRNPSRRLTSTLAPAYAACATGLLLLAVPVAFDGMSVEIGWAILAIAMAIVGRASKSKIAHAGACVAWVCALAHLIVTAPGADVFQTHAPVKIWLTLLGEPIASTTILAWGLAFVGHIIAGLMREDAEGSRVASGAMSVVASIVFVATSIIALPALGATLAMILFAWALLVADIPAPRLKLAMHSIGILLAATVKWVAVDTLGQRLSPDWSAAQYAPILNPLMGIGLLLAGSLVGAYWLRRESIKQALPQGRHAPLAASVAMVVVALLAIAFSFEIDRVVERAVLAQTTLTWPAWQLKQMAWTMLWSLCAVLLSLAISRISALGERRTSWMGAIEAFAALMVVKFIVLDTLIYRLSDGGGTARLLFNLQTMTAAIVVGALVAIRALGRSAKPQAEDEAAAGSKLHLLALFVVAWTGSFEIDRFIALHPAMVSPWPVYQFKQMVWTMWWTICAAAGFVIGRRFDRTANVNSGWARLLSAIIVMLAVKFMLADALFWRMTDPVTLAPVFANVQMLTAVVSMGALILLVAMGMPGDAEAWRPARVRAGFLAWLLALLAISLEIDRFFEGPRAGSWLADAHLAKQVAFSIVWSIFAVMSVAAGFRIRLASLRYFGLTLLAITLIKVVFVDLGQVSTGYRILSFLGLGALMLGTSVLYGKLSPKLLREDQPAAC
jgi:uncharacterized membrane protein